METSKRDRLGPDAWVDAAYAVFRDEGVDAVRVEALAKRLGITRGSFYWHFADRAALLRAVLDRWVESDTGDVIHANEAAGGTAAQRLRRLLATCASVDGRLEVGMRNWAARDAQARAILARVDARRVDYLAALTAEAGVAAEAAKARARVAYLAWLGSYADVSAPAAARRLADMDCLWRMMLAPAEGEEPGSAKPTGGEMRAAAKS